MKARLALTILFGAALGGCSDLQPVAEFGKNASVIAGYPDVAADFPATLQRQRLYGDNGPAVSDEKIAVRKHDAERLRKAQGVLEAYARALGALAADDLISYDKQIDQLNQSIIDANLATSAETDVYVKATKFVLGLGTDIYRRKKLRDLITTYNPPVQKATQNLITIVEGGYLTALADERTYFDKYVAGPAIHTTEQSEGLPQIVRVVAAQEDDILDKKEQNAKELVKGMRTFAQGHQKLASNIGKVSFKETASIARQYANQLRDILKSLHS